jgi:hypothetical protein
VIVLTFVMCLAWQCEPGVQYQRAAGYGEARACTLAFEFVRARARPEALFKDVECKMEEKK